MSLCNVFSLSCSSSSPGPYILSPGPLQAAPHLMSLLRSYFHALTKIFRLKVHIGGMHLPLPIPHVLSVRPSTQLWSTSLGGTTLTIVLTGKVLNQNNLCGGRSGNIYENAPEYPL